MTQRSPEFSLRAVLLGSVLGIVFGLVTVYIALRVGLNFSASIPIAVLAITVFKRLGHPSILEQNIVQTVGSAGESIAAGAVYTFPALLFLGYELELWRIFWLALIGGVLGVLFMVPLRQYLIVKEHGHLPYPEGTACADILIAGDRGGEFARPVFVGLVVGGGYKLLMSGLHLWRTALDWTLPGVRGAVLSVDLSPELLGIGCLIGLPVARVIFAGSLMSGVVLIPLIYFFGGQLPAPIYPSTVPIDQMSPSDIWSNYIRYVGAGAVIAGGIRLLAEAMPTVWRSLRGGARGLRDATERSARTTLVAATDLGVPLVLGGSALMLLGLFVLLAWKINPHSPGNVVSTLLVAAFGFFFVVVSARITGIMGSSANPISGITIAVLMLTCLLFVLAGWTGRSYEIIAVSIGAVVCIAASNAGTTAQDLKTGYLLGASPRLQQLGLLIGVLTSVLLIGFTLMWLNGSGRPPTALPATALPAGSRLEQRGVEYAGKRFDVYAITSTSGALTSGRYLVDPSDRLIAYRQSQRIGSSQLPAPQAQVMAILVDGLLNRRMRWPLLLAGFVIALVIELAGVRSLPFAVGMYLPLSATASLLIGAAITHWANPKAAAALDDPFRPGVLYSSGLIAGGAISAIAIAVLMSGGLLDRVDLGARLGWAALDAPAWALLMFVGLCATSWRAASRPSIQSGSSP